MMHILNVTLKLNFITKLKIEKNIGNIYIPTIINIQNNYESKNSNSLKIYYQNIKRILGRTKRRIAVVEFEIILPLAA